MTIKHLHHNVVQNDDKQNWSNQHHFCDFVPGGKGHARNCLDVDRPTRVQDDTVTHCGGIHNAVLIGNTQCDMSCIRLNTEAAGVNARAHSSLAMFEQQTW
ncbi:hypothetical protein ACA910_016853 [Epithemia clementina (nom. ined.)]